MIDLNVISFVDHSDEEATKIEEYYLTRITEKACSIQVFFRHPEKISEIITDLDKL